MSVCMLKYYRKTHIYIYMAKPGNLMSVAKMHRLRIRFMGCSSALVTVLRKWIKTAKTIQFVVKWLAVFCPAVTDEAVGTIKLKMGVWYFRVMTVCHVKITAENGKFHAWRQGVTFVLSITHVAIQLLYKLWNILETVSQVT